MIASEGIRGLAPFEGVMNVSRSKGHTTGIMDGNGGIDGLLKIHVFGEFLALMGLEVSSNRRRMGANGVGRFDGAHGIWTIGRLHPLKVGLVQQDRHSTQETAVSRRLVGRVGGSESGVLD